MRKKIKHSPKNKAGIKTLSDSELKIFILESKTLCQELDPFAPIPPNVFKKLETLGVQCSEENIDPFAITNQLILLLENALEEELQRRGPVQKNTPSQNTDLRL